MVPPGQSPATYEHNPKQVSVLSEADVLFTIGLLFEQSFLPRIRENITYVLTLRLIYIIILVSIQLVGKVRSKTGGIL